MSSKPLAHPLKWWQFYAAIARYAATGVLGVIGNTGTILAGVVFACKLLRPALYAGASLFLKAHGFREDALIEIPLWIGGAILLFRLLTAPFAIYRDKGNVSDVLPSHELAFRQLKTDNEDLRRLLANNEARTLLISQATQIENGLKPIVDWITPVHTRMAEMFVVATTGAPDSLHYAQSLSGPLKTAFHVDVIGPGEWYYDPQDATGLLLIEPSEFPADFPDYGQILIDAFASAGLTVARYPSPGYLLRFILLVGRKPLR